MKLIAHRGNTNGPNVNDENNPSYIKSALSLGFDVEIDVWYVDKNFFLGHDGPQYLLHDESLIQDKRAWCHAKNIEAFEKMIKMQSNCFWHQEDDYTLTSSGFIWTFPGKTLTKNSVCVTNEKILAKENFKKLENACFGICSDYVSMLESYK